jgi:hypothetical protein
MKRLRVLLAAIPAAILGITMIRKLMRREERAFTPVAPGEGGREEPLSEEAMLTDVGASITPEASQSSGGAEAAMEADAPAASEGPESEAKD